MRGVRAPDPLTAVLGGGHLLAVAGAMWWPDGLPDYRRYAGIDVMALAQLLVRYTRQLDPGDQPIRAVYAARIALRDLQGQGVEGMDRANAVMGRYLARAGYDTSDLSDPVIATWTRLARHPVHEDLQDRTGAGTTEPPPRASCSTIG